MKREAWEALCRRCGKCCYEKRYTAHGLIVDYRLPCRFLDEATHLCRVYERRFRACPECRRMTIFHALFSTCLPDSCGYVVAFRRRFQKMAKIRQPPSSELK